MSNLISLLACHFQTNINSIMLDKCPSVKISLKRGIYKGKSGQRIFKIIPLGEN